MIDLLEVYLLADRVGETFTGTVIEVDRGKATRHRDDRGASRRGSGHR